MSRSPKAKTDTRSASHSWRATPLLVALLLLLTLPFSTRADYSLTVNPATTYGTWDGWGCSLCWWANVFGTRTDLANLVFTTNYTVLNGENLPGLGLNIARYNAGGCTTSSIAGTGPMTASPNIPAFRQMPGFWLDWNNSDPNSASWQWTADANQRAMLLLARARGANWLELFSNSPMWWMCYNHNPSGADNGGSDNLQNWNYDAHAVYLANIAARAATNWGVTFNSVEPFNEPSANWWNSTGSQEGCHFDPSTQASVIPLLWTELKNRGLTNAVVAASDENTYDGATSTWNSFTAAVRGQVGRVNVHGYQYGGGRRDLLHTAVAGKRLWNSEYGDSDGTGMSLASNLNLDFTWLHPTGWCYWQPLDSGGWGLIQSNTGDNWIGNSNPKYYVLAHYTRHIRPGMTILDSGDGNSVAAYDPAARKLVLVTVNYGTRQTINYDLSHFGYAAGPVRRWTTQPGATPAYVLSTAIGIVNRSFQSGFLTNSLQTFEIANVDFAPPATPTNLVATAGIGRVSLVWAPSVGATNYVVGRARTSNGPFPVIATLSGTNLVDTLPAGSPAGAYYYVVAAVNGAGSSTNSPPVAAIPAAPPALSVSWTSPGGTLVFSWPTWATNFTLYSATNLTPPSAWLALNNLPVATNGAWTVRLPASPENRRYYRLGSP